VTLPASVENLIERIRHEQNQPPLDPIPRTRLAAIGEEHALQILNHISQRPITKTLNHYVMHLLKQQQQPTYSFSPPPPSPPLQSSPLSSLPSQLQTSPLAFPSLEDSSVVTALGELEFRKSFLMLSYAGG